MFRGLDCLHEDTMQCEMCGKQTESLKVALVEGSELDVCSDCESFGEVLHEESDDGGAGETAGSAASSGGTGGTASTTTSGGGGGGGGRRDPFEEMGALAADYPERVREAREAMELTQEELADRLNEKQSLIRKIERGDMRPDEDVRGKLESTLEVSLTEEVAADDWESEDSGEGYTLGDIVERKD